MLSSENESDSDRDVNEVENHNDWPTRQVPDKTTTSRKRKCPSRDQPFMDNWLTIPEFKGLLTKKLCEKVLTCSKTGMKRHEVSKKHQEKAKTTTTTSTIRQKTN